MILSIHRRQQHSVRTLVIQRLADYILVMIKVVIIIIIVKIRPAPLGPPENLFPCCPHFREQPAHQRPVLLHGRPGVELDLHQTRQLLEDLVQQVPGKLRVEVPGDAESFKDRVRRIALDEHFQRPNAHHLLQAKPAGDAPRLGRRRPAGPEDQLHRCDQRAVAGRQAGQRGQPREVLDGEHAESLCRVEELRGLVVHAARREEEGQPVGKRREGLVPGRGADIAVGPRANLSSRPKEHQAVDLETDLRRQIEESEGSDVLELVVLFLLVFFLRVPVLQSDLL